MAPSPERDIISSKSGCGKGANTRALASSIASCPHGPLPPNTRLWRGRHYPSVAVLVLLEIGADTLAEQLHAEVGGDHHDACRALAVADFVENFVDLVL